MNSPPSPSTVDPPVWFEATRAWTDALIDQRLAEVDLGPPRLAEAVGYALLGGGKRVRPALCRMVFSAVTKASAPPSSIELMGAAAFGVECIHTYSLVHDDLPCMDDDDLRRGRATVHKVYGEATGVLVGDALQSLAFEALGGAGGASAARAVLCLARASGGAGMVGGQVLDLAGEGADLGVEEVEAIHSAKTATLLGAAAELGAIAGSESTEAAAEARAFGHALGMCFQAMDDVLDVTGDAGTLGKTPGKDASASKGTLVAALGLDGARAAAVRHADAAKAAAESLGLGSLGLGFVEMLLSRKS